MASLVLREGKYFCSQCGAERDRNATFCCDCRYPLVQTPAPAVESGPGRPSVIVRKGCFVCSECRGDVAPKASYCPRCRASFDGSPVPPAPAVNYHCLTCNSDVPAGAAFCPGCGTRITRYYGPGEKAPASIVELQAQQKLWLTLVIIGLVITFLSWFVCR